MTDSKKREGAVPRGLKNRRAKGLVRGSVAGAVMAVAATAMMPTPREYEITDESSIFKGREPKYKPLGGDGLPDRMSGDPDSVFYHPECTKIAVYLDGKRRPNDTNEYCISEGWITTISYDRKRQIIRHNGKNGKPIVSRRKEGKVVVILKYMEPKDE